MTAVRTSRLYRSYSRVRQRVALPRKLKARVKPHVPKPRTRSVRRRVLRSKEPDPHLAGRA